MTSCRPCLALAPLIDSVLDTVFLPSGTMSFSLYTRAHASVILSGLVVPSKLGLASRNFFA